MFKLVLEKTEEPKIKLPTSAGFYSIEDLNSSDLYYISVGSFIIMLSFQSQRRAMPKNVQTTAHSSHTLAK